MRIPSENLQQATGADSLGSIRTSRFLLTGDMVLQWPLFKERWKTILFGAIFQYVHGIFTQLAHRMARPTAEPLHVGHPCVIALHCVCFHPLQSSILTKGSKILNQPKTD